MLSALVKNEPKQIERVLVARVLGYHFAECFFRLGKPARLIVAHSRLHRFLNGHVATLPERSCREIDLFCALSANAAQYSYEDANAKGAEAGDQPRAVRQQPRLRI